MSAPTILEILNKSAEFFRIKGIENFRLDAQLLIGNILNMERMELYLNFDRPMTPIEIAKCRDVISRRAKREPLQHIIGKVPFRNLQLKTDKRALIPRPETELIIDFLSKLVPNLVQGTYENPKIKLRGLEIGIGSGAIILSILKEFSNLYMTGIDISEDALSLTQENAFINNLDLPGTLGTLIKSDLFENIVDLEPWDFIISNPPYISTKEYETLDPEVKNWDPYFALVGGTIGTECIEKILTKSFSKIKMGGWLILEIGYNQASIIQEKATLLGWQNIHIKKDYNNIERFIAFQKKP